MSELGDFLDPASVVQLERLQVIARRVVEGFLRGLHQSPRKGSSIEYAGHRPYSRGDDLRRLDWRSFARTDRFYVKEFEDETNLRALLVLDVSASMGFGSTGITKLRYASVLAAALGYLLLGQRDAIGLALVDSGLRRYIPPRAKAEHLAGIFDAIEAAEARGVTRSKRMLHHVAERVPGRSLVILLSDLLDEPENVLAGLSELRQRRSDAIIFHVLDPAEIEPPFDSWMVLRDLEDPTFEVRLDARRMRERYLENLKAHRDALEKGAQAAGVDYLFLDTREPFEAALGRFLHARARRR